MTSPPSSTSSSELHYLKALGVVLGALVTLLVTITATGYRLGLVEVANHAIYSYQRDKLDAARTIDIAFVGDSSLGNAIDATLFSSLAGHPAVNLALTGSYGSGGAYNMTYKVLQHHTPGLIVIMQSIDVMRRTEAFPGFYFSAEPSQLLDDFADSHSGTVLQPQDGPARGRATLEAGSRQAGEVVRRRLHRPDERLLAAGGAGDGSAVAQHGRAVANRLRRPDRRTVPRSTPPNAFTHTARSMTDIARRPGSMWRKWNLESRQPDFRSSPARRCAFPRSNLEIRSITSDRISKAPIRDVTSSCCGRTSNARSRPLERRRETEDAPRERAAHQGRIVRRACLRTTRCRMRRA